MLKKLFRLLKIVIQIPSYWKYFLFVWFHPLNHNNRLASIWRVMSFQIASRIIKAPIILPFVNGTQLITCHGMSGATGDWYCGLREYEDMSFLLHTLQSGDLFVDVGANIGSYSILAATCKGVDVIAFEPIPSTFSYLKKNIKLNLLDNQVRAMNIGLADQKGTLHFSQNLDTINHVILNNEKNYPSVNIEVQRLDDVLEKKCPTMIKIDVEGYETQVLQGAKKVIDNPTLIAVIVELNESGKRYGKDDNDVHQLLISKGFDCFKYDPFKYRLKSLQSKFNKISNTLYLRNLDEIQSRISKKNAFILGTGQKI